MTVKIKIEAWPTTDVYYRYHGLAVDQELNEDFWRSQPHKVIGVTPPQPVVFEKTLDLAPGEHTLEYATSGYVPDYAWHAKIYVDGKLAAEGDVGRYKQHHLKAKFTVGAPPPPPTPPPSPPAEKKRFPVIAVASALFGLILVVITR